MAQIPRGDGGTRNYASKRAQISRVSIGTDLALSSGMPTQIVGLHRPAHVRLSRVIPFRAISELPASAPDGVDVEERHEAASVCCQPGAAPRRGTDCQECPRFLGWRDDAAGLRVRCAWSERDRVRDGMTLAGALIVTGPRATCRDAAALAARHQVRHLLVVDGLWLVGVVAARELGGGGRVEDRMTRDIFAILGDATLGEALAAMVALDVGMLPVIGERFVIGVITRGDLMRLGLPPQRFDTPRLTLSEAGQVAAVRDDAEARDESDDSGAMTLADDTLP
jgi:CBS domain-containing protein